MAKILLALLVLAVSACSDDDPLGGDIFMERGFWAYNRRYFKKARVTAATLRACNDLPGVQVCTLTSRYELNVWLAKPWHWDEVQPSVVELMRAGVSDGE